jgi:hypothetical protein
MLTAKQYEAIGRLTLSFNQIGFLVEAYFAYIIGSPELAASMLIAREDNFARNVQRFIRILKAITGARAAQRIQIQVVIGLLENARRLAVKRNGYVHALVVNAYGEGNAKLNIGSEVIPCDESEILKTEKEVLKLCKDLDRQCMKLLEGLERARYRDGTRTPQLPYRWFVRKEQI